MNTAIFSKHIYTLSTISADGRNIFDNIDSLRRVARCGRMSRAFADKIMLVVTSINGYRNFFDGHSRAAASGHIGVHLETIWIHSSRLFLWLFKAKGEGHQVIRNVLQSEWA